MNIYTIAIIFIIFVFFYFSMEHFSTARDSVRFMADRDTSAFLKADRDMYVRNMSPCDLYARKAKNHSEYIDRISSCSVSFDSTEMAKLYRCAKKADIFLQSHTYKGIDCKRIAKIDWVFAKTRKNGAYEYEEGLPHTRDNVILLSNYVINGNVDDMLVSTLIHEKMHIYQRHNSMDHTVASMGYKQVPLEKVDKKRLYLKRCNPDTDNRVFSKNNRVIVFVYKSHKPSGINDVETSNFTMEHPYEEMAYEISNDYMKKQMREII